MKIVIELTPAQYRQLVQSLNNDWMDNEPNSKRLIEAILKKLEERRVS